MSDDELVGDAEPMFVSPERQALLAASVALSVGNLHGAVMHLRRSLGADPHQADAHALLARVLTAQRRLHAAEYEANAALAIDPELVEAHFAAAEVQLAGRRLGEARKSLEQALALEPNQTAALLGLARLATLQGRRTEALRELERALAISPDSPEVLVALGNWHLDAGHLDEAARFAERARDGAQDDLEVLVLLGHVALRRGQVEVAHDHALWALGQNAADPAALGLMASIRARQSPLLGLWWRYSVWMTARGDSGQVVILLVAWLAFRVAELASRDLGVPALATTFNFVWLGLALYSWVGPGLFRRAVEKELEQVRLRGGF